MSNPEFPPLEIHEPESEETDKGAMARTPEELRERNLEVFRKYFPHLHQQLRDHKPASELVIDENGEPNIRHQDFEMYPGGALTYARRQLEEFWKKPGRILLSPPQGDGLDVHSRKFVTDIAKRAADSGIEFRFEPVTSQSYYTIVFGIGLGAHLDEMVLRTQPQVMVLIEPNPDLLYHSTFVYDWGRLMETFDDRCGLQIYTETDPQKISNFLKGIFRAYNPASMDGTVVFEHYPSAIFQEAHKQLEELYRTALMGLGFYEDELNMVCNTYKNFENGESRVIREPGIHVEAPVFIVGTGPSLDRLLPLIEENKDRAVIVACGTAVDVLLHNGITPDFHVFTERDSMVLDQVHETRDLYGLEGMCLGASTTIYPGAPELYDETIFFFRPGLTPRPVFATQPDQVVSHPDPLAANGGLGFVLHLGFRTFYLLGVDVGSKFKTHAHAGNSWYSRHNAENVTDLSVAMPGNFGGTVWSTPMYQWSKEVLESAISSRPGNIYYNCSDGAAINGAVPLYPEAIELKELKEPKKEVIRRLIEACPKYTREALDEQWTEAALTDRIRDFVDDLNGTLEKYDDLSDMSYLNDIMKILVPNRANSALAMLTRGTIFSVFLCFEFFSRRIVDPELRKVFENIFREEFAIAMDEMAEEGIKVFTALEEGREIEIAKFAYD